MTDRGQGGAAAACDVAPGGGTQGHRRVVVLDWHDRMVPYAQVGGVHTAGTRSTRVRCYQLVGRCGNRRWQLAAVVVWRNF